MTTPNHTSEDALAYFLERVRSVLGWATDSIAGNIPYGGNTAQDLYDGNEAALDAITDLIDEAEAIRAQHVHSDSYSDGRPIRSFVDIPERNTRFEHLWPADPSLAERSSVEIDGQGVRSVVTILPPATVRVETTRTLAVVREAEEHPFDGD